MTEQQAKARVARWRKRFRYTQGVRLSDKGANWCAHVLSGCGFPTIAARIAGYQFRADNVGIDFWSGQAKGTSRRIQVGSDTCDVTL